MCSGCKRGNAGSDEPAAYRQSAAGTLSRNELPVETLINARGRRTVGRAFQVTLEMLGMCLKLERIMLIRSQRSTDFRVEVPTI